MTFKKSLLVQCKHPFTSEKYSLIKIDMSRNKPLFGLDIPQC